MIPSEELNRSRQVQRPDEPECQLIRRLNGSLLPCCLMLLLLMAGCGPGSDTAENGDEPARPNIIFVMTDDQGYGDVGYMGNPDLITPNIDAMAENGLRFDRYYTASPVCSPTRASVLTGRHPNRTGTFTWGHALRPEELTVATLLKGAGYRTGFFGKWHVGSVREGQPTSPGEHGFDEWYAAPNFYLNDPWMSHNGTPVQLIGESSVVTAEVALEFIEQAAGDGEPFMAFVWTGAPHVPHEASDELKALYPDLPENLQNYYGEISGIDRAVGMLRDGVRELGIEEETVLWFTSDNGGRLPESYLRELRGEKSELWEGGIRVPSVVEWPGTIEQRISQQPAGSVDLFPTFLELAGVEMDQGRPLDGVSLVSLMRDEAAERNAPLGFWHYGPVVGGQLMRSDEIVLDLQKFLDGELEEENLIEGRMNPPGQTYEGLEELGGPIAWIDGEWKLHRLESGEYELYHVANDPGEEQNVLDEYPDRVASMKTDLQEWLDSVIRSAQVGDY